MTDKELGITPDEETLEEMKEFDHITETTSIVDPRTLEERVDGQLSLVLKEVKLLTKEKYPDLKTIVVGNSTSIQEITEDNKLIKYCKVKVKVFMRNEYNDLEGLFNVKIDISLSNIDTMVEDFVKETKAKLYPNQETTGVYKTFMETMIRSSRL